MHWFAEWMGFTILIAFVAVIWMSIHFIPKWRAEKKVADLEYVKRAAFISSFKSLYNANTYAIAELDSPLYDFPDQIMTELLDAHMSAGKFIK